MSYVTRAQMIERFGREELIQLTDRDDIGRIDDAVLQAAIDDAARIIDSRIGAAVALPLEQAAIDASPLPRIAGDIARYLLMDDGPTTEATERYRAAEKWLDAVATGRAVLASTSAPAGGGWHLRPGGNGGIDWGTY